MASKNKIVLESKFPAAKKAVYETVQFARALALKEGEDTSNDRIARASSQRGYPKLSEAIHVEKENIGFQSGRIFVETNSEKWGSDPFWARFFEYGTHNIKPMPFMRPGARVMRKTFLGVMGKELDGFIRRKASVHRQ